MLANTAGHEALHPSVSVNEELRREHIQERTDNVTGEWVTLLPSCIPRS
jgi:hypothetical protein